MALSGVFYGSTSNQYVKPKIEWSAVQSPEGNYSDVTAILSYSRTNTGYKTESTWYGSITIDGQTLEGKVFATVTYNSNTVVLTFENVRVYHDADGYRDVAISAEGYFYNTKTYDTVISSVVTLDQIPQAAKVSATAANIEEVSTVTVTGLREGYTYTLKAEFGELSGYLNASGVLRDNPVELTERTIPFQIPESFYEQIPDSPDGVCSLQCVTLKNGQQVGKTQTASFAVTAKKALCKPLVSGTVVDVREKTVALTGDQNILVRYASTAYCTISAQSQNGAAVSKKQIGGVTVSGDTRSIEKITTGSVSFLVVDTRGYENSTTVKKSVIPYIPLTLNATVSRTDPTSGNAVLRVWGNCYCGSFGVKDNSLCLHYAVNGGTLQSVTLQIGSDHTFDQAVALTGLNYETTHSVSVWAEDAVQTTGQKTVTVGKGVPVFDWSEEDFVFHVPVSCEQGLTAEGKSVFDLIYPVGAVYISASEVSPATLFGGAWEQIKDVFLLAAGTRLAGVTGGEEQHLLTSEEMPSHTHGMYWRNKYGLTGSGNGVTNAEGGDTTEGTDYVYMDTAGGSHPHNNMPPYLTVYMWKRTA